ncbi:SMI1/KNR4 family protein [Streptomyces triculaminicus]|uniref:SMI1/KNR4 family protein n=1 Tax=Streptomyces triculaminicus TaxID=2816232 RepID=UPI0037B7CE77
MNHEETQEGSGQSGSGALRVFMPPHENAGDDVDWSAAERAWGVKFPRDYVDFMSVYGEGVIGNFLSIFQPLSTAYDASAYGMRFETDNAHGLIDQHPSSWPAGLTQDTPHSIIAWGVNSSADILCWSTVDQDPDRWPVVVLGRHTSPPVAIYECGMAEFLRRVFLADFDECPMSGLDLWAVTSPKFLHWREEKRLWDAGIDPWTGEPDPYAGMEWD